MFLIVFLIITVAHNDVSATELATDQLQPTDLAAAQQRLKKYMPPISNPDFDKQLETHYNNQQLRLLNKIRTECSERTWRKKKQQVKEALALAIHPDDIILVTHWQMFDPYQHETPLARGVITNDLNLTQTLLAAHANPNQAVSDHDFKQILFEAKSPEMVQLLLAHKGDATCSSPNYGETLLHQGGWRAPLTKTLALLFFSAGACANKISLAGCSSLIDSLEKRDPELSATLVKLGSSLDARSCHDNSSNGKLYREILEDDPKQTETLKEIEKAKEEVAQAKIAFNVPIISALMEVGIYKNCSAIIASYAEEHVLPPTIKAELETIAQRYPCEISKLPNYEEEQETTGCNCIIS